MEKLNNMNTKPTKEIIKLYREMKAKQKTDDTAKEVVRSLYRAFGEALNENEINTISDLRNHLVYTPVTFQDDFGNGDIDIIKKTMAFYDLCILIDNGYGGLVDLDNIGYHFYSIQHDGSLELFEECESEDGFKNCYPLIFQSYEDVKRFISYEENKLLIEDLYGIELNY